jgi:hypothetical protein
MLLLLLYDFSFAIQAFCFSMGERTCFKTVLVATVAVAFAS